jgi:hypothetical protein
MKPSHSRPNIQSFPQFNKPDEDGGCWDVEGRAGGFPYIYPDDDRVDKIGVLKFGR